jgi:cyanophycinase
MAGQGQSLRGALVIVGGAERHDGDNDILEQFVELAGSVRSPARIVVCGLASEEPEEMEDIYRPIFEGFGAEVAALDLDRIAEQGRWATAVWMTGGDQQRLLDSTKDTPFVDVLRSRRDEGLVLGGTSAGASIMSTTMIVAADGPEGTGLTVDLCPGFGFIEAIVDQHFAERGRINRLLAALQKSPQHGDLGIGIDEATAIIEMGGRFRVTGANSVTVIDATDAGFPPHDDDNLVVCDARVHVLEPGFGFSLGERRILSKEEAADLVDNLALRAG